MDKNKKRNEDNKELEELKKKAAEFDALKELASQIENLYKRAVADYRNLENRVQNERGEWILKANRSLLLNLLPILDTLMLADKHSQGKDQTINLSIQQFLDILKKEGVTKIETENKEFDPNLMDAIATVEVDPSTGSGQGEGKVIDEARAGYMLYDKILRPAQVTVGKEKATSN